MAGLLVVLGALVLVRDLAHGVHLLLLVVEIPLPLPSLPELAVAHQAVAAAHHQRARQRQDRSGANGGDEGELEGVVAVVSPPIGSPVEEEDEERDDEPADARSDADQVQPHRAATALPLLRFVPRRLNTARGALSAALSILAHTRKDGGADRGGGKEGLDLVHRTLGPPPRKQELRGRGSS